MADPHMKFKRQFGSLWRRSLALLILTPLLALQASLGLAAPLNNLRFEQLGIEQGLPHELVQAMLQDRQGFIWIGTQSGLARYDGVHITFYRPNNGKPNSLAAPWITALHEDAKGRLWVGTRGGGLQRYNATEENFIRYADDKDRLATPGRNQILTIKGDGANGIWLGTMDGLVHFDPDSGQFKVWHHDVNDPASISNDQINALVVDAERNLWIATPTGLDRLPAGISNVEHYRLNGSVAGGNRYNEVRALLLDRSGALWIGSSAGLEVLEPTGSRRRLGTAQGLSPGIVTALYQDQDGAVWVGTQDDGLKRWDAPSEHFQSYRNHSSDPHSLADGRVVTLLQDRSGILWVGTWNRGISRVDLVGGGFDRFVHLAGDSRTIGAGRVQGLAADAQDRIWFGTSEGGLNRLDMHSGAIEHFTHKPGVANNLSHDTVRAVQVNHQGIWIGSAGGLDLLDPETGRFTHFTHDASKPGSLASNQIYTLYFDRAGILWIGTMDAGLDRFDPVTRRFRHYPRKTRDADGLASALVTRVLEDRQGNFWVATSNGLDLLDRQSGRIQHFRHDEKDATSLSQSIVTDVFEDSRGTLWVGTTSGLNRMQRGTDGTIRFQRYSTRDGLENDVVLDILEASDGNLWLGTNAGLSRLDPRSGSVRNFTAANGLIDGTYMVAGSLRDRLGRLYFGGTRGLTVFDPANIRDNQVPPQLALTDFLIFNRSMRGQPGEDGFRMDGTISNAKQVTLSYQYSVFSIEFAALHYADPLHNRYAYKLEGFDKNWVSTDANHRVATYTNLDPGTYVFRVRAASKEGPWNEDGASLTITITPPFWKTWWFRLLVTVLAAALVYLAYRSRIRNYARQQIRLEGQVRERTAEALAARTMAEQKSSQVSSLLDHSGQGFLSFSANLLIDAEYSAECIRIFDRRIEGLYLPALLYGDDKQRQYLEKNLQHVFRSSDETRREIYMELLPMEYRLYGCDYEAKYRFLGDARIMMILTDVSDAKALQERVRQEQQRVDFLVNAMENRNDLLDTLQVWRQFSENVLPALLNSSFHPRAVLTEIHREIHTYKGLFAQEGLPAMPLALHDLEGRLAALHEYEMIDQQLLIRTVDEVDLRTPLESDLAMLREKLGASYFVADKLVQLQAGLLGQLEQAALACVDTNTAAGVQLQEVLQRLYYQPLSAMLALHFKATVKMASRLGKELAPITCEGDDVQVDPRVLTPFCKSLVNVFRNCVDHGIEDPESRLRAGKSEIGRIHCRIEQHQDYYLLCIGDDGRGIDVEQIRNRVVERGLISAEQAQARSSAMVLRFIFMDGLSTRDLVSELSGRGVGLAATLSEIEKLGGTVELVSTPGQGTEFRFMLPLKPLSGSATHSQGSINEYHQQ
jgi:ligand-binding sensor domain-containing protein/signal transduction histidine kinase